MDYRSVPHGHLNITCDFGPHGCLPGILHPYVCIEAAIDRPLEMRYMGAYPEFGACPGHYSIDIITMLFFSAIVMNGNQS